MPDGNCKKSEKKVEPNYNKPYEIFRELYPITQWHIYNQNKNLVLSQPHHIDKIQEKKYLIKQRKRGKIKGKPSIRDGMKITHTKKKTKQPISVQKH